MTKNSTRLVCVPYSGFISILNITGPIVQPVAVSEQTAFKLVCAGYPVEEVISMTNHKKLTIRDFGGSDSKPEVKVEPKKVETETVTPVEVVTAEPEVVEEAPTRAVEPDFTTDSKKKKNKKH